MYIYIQNLKLNDLQVFVCQKTSTNQPPYIYK